MVYDERLLKVPLPTDLLRRMDQLLVARVGGYETRTQFVHAAIKALVADLDPASPPAKREKPITPGMEAQTRPRLDEAVSDLTTTALILPSHVAFIDKGDATIDDSPLFGLHNRDYPTLWAAVKLAELSRVDLVPFDSFVKLTTERAWQIARVFAGSSVNGLKLTALFPSNEQKRQSSEQAFASFALGSVVAREGTLRATGALFQWQLAQVRKTDGSCMIGLTRQGFDLLHELEGLSLNLPHSPSQFESFFRHLRRWCSADADCWLQALTLVGASPTREEALRSFQREHQQWSPIQTSTNLAGYISRGREWGLIEPKQVDGRYRLTPFGVKVIRKAVA